MLENPARDPFVVDERDQAHRSLALPTAQHVDREHALEQLRPFEPASAAGVVGAVVVALRYDDRRSAQDERMDARYDGATG